MKKYTTPEMDLITLNESDIITTSVQIPNYSSSSSTPLQPVITDANTDGGVNGGASN